jgi:class 3 adenylate cyclase
MCGAAIGRPDLPRESRKNVVVLFADIVGSTALAERLDPEMVRQILDQYFAACAAVIADYGGVVEKFIGDAVMAVFAVPVAHGDDALRAVRAALGLTAAITDLNASLRQTHGTRLELRTGICSGQAMVTILAGGEFRVVGDAVNTASRLQSAAAPGEILISAQTARMVRGQVGLTPVPPLTLKGKAAAVPAFRVDSPESLPEAAAAVPLIGRDHELARLAEAYRETSARGQCRRVTVLGPPGIGKSRLAREFAATAPGATSITASCLSYGRGATYQPVIALVGSLDGGWATAGPALSDDPQGERALDCLRGLCGTGQAGAGRSGNGGLAAGAAEIAWAVHRLLEALARRGPLIVVWDDLHAAEPTLLDLIEDVASWLAGAPVLMLCLARPELTETRPQWGHGGSFATTVDLAQLSAEQSAELVAQLASQQDVHAQELDEASVRVVTACEGNPLFAGLMLDMIADGADSTVLPPTVQALLEARLDQVSSAERDLLEKAAVIGREFTATQLAILLQSPERPPAAGTLRLLQDRGLIQGSGEPGAFRFTQAMLRDTAYGVSPKSERARWHQALADWLTGQPDPPSDLLGYHLEAACVLTRDIRPGDRGLPSLAARAADVLVADGLLAMRRNDLPAAVALLERGANLLPPGDARHRPLALHISDCRIGLWDEAGALAALAAAERAMPGDARTAVACATQRCILALRAGSASPESLAAEADRIAGGLGGDPGDFLGWCRYYQLRAFLLLAGERIADAQAALRAAMNMARRAGDRDEEDRIATGICELAVWGPATVADGLALCSSLTDRFAADRVLLVPVVATRAGLAALAGDVASARGFLADARRYVRDLHLGLAAAVVDQMTGVVESVAGAHQAAADAFRSGAAAMRAAGQLPGAQTLEVCAAREVFADGRAAEAEQLLDEATAGRQETDMRTGLLAVALRGRLAAAAGRSAEGLAAAQQAADLAERTDDLRIQGDVRFDLAEVLALSGHDAQAVAVAGRAAGSYAAKGALLPSRRVAAWLSARRPPAAGGTGRETRKGGNG